MATLNIRNIGESLKEDLRTQAAKNGRSMEEEVRQILRANVQPRVQLQENNFALALRHMLAPSGFVELELPKR